LWAQMMAVLRVVLMAVKLVQQMVGSSAVHSVGLMAVLLVRRKAV